MAGQVIPTLASVETSERFRADLEARLAAAEDRSRVPVRLRGAAARLRAAVRKNRLATVNGASEAEAGITAAHLIPHACSRRYGQAPLFSPVEVVLPNDDGRPVVITLQAAWVARALIVGLTQAAEILDERLPTREEWDQEQQC